MYLSSYWLDNLPPHSQLAELR
eukprot:COSAG06_NODE_22777_length_712_cov_2951.358891_2_plen_21_part_01